METPWIIERLTAYLELLDEFDLVRYHTGEEAVTRELQMRERETQAIISATGARLPGHNLFMPTQRGDGATSTGRLFARQAIGWMQIKDELAQRLAPTAPTFPADKLHPWVWDQARGLWGTGRYAVAVGQAATGISTHVQFKVDRHDIQDTDLMNQVFSASAPEAGKPRLRYEPEDVSRSAQSIREGLGRYASGCYMVIRNPATHRPEDEMTEQEGLERLAALSLLARYVERCEVLTAD